jgi:DNA-binding CsgD family transcriptional regulator/PAS domain-containing protein
VGELEQISELIGLIYDASLDPGLWPSTLGRTAAFVPGLSATLFAKDAGSKSGNIYYDDGGLEPIYKQLYFEKYIKIDPSHHGQVFAEIEQPVSMLDWNSHAEFLQSRFYQEWVRPQGIVDIVCAVLDKSATGAALFGVFRHERHGLVDDEARRRMRLIAPHVRRAALIGKVIDLKTAQAATFADTLDGITAGMFLVDQKGRVVHANAAGTAMLAQADILHAPAGRLLATDAQANRSLGDIFESAGSDEALGVKGIAMPLMARDGDRYLAHLLPLTSGARRQAGVSFNAVAALFVRKAALEGPGPAEVIAKTYKLTPTELRVLLAVVEVGGAPEVAEALGVAETTIKFHLKGLFEKTGTRRQADLVKIVAGYSNMPAG